MLRNSRSSRAASSLVTAERSSATPAAPAGESHTVTKVRTSRSPAPSIPPATACGTNSAGFIGKLTVAANSFSLVPK